MLSFRAGADADGLSVANRPDTRRSSPVGFSSIVHSDHGRRVDSKMLIARSALQRNQEGAFWRHMPPSYCAVGHHPGFQYIILVHKASGLIVSSPSPLL